MKVHVGCGKRNFGTGWHNVDGGDFSHVHSKDIYLEDVPRNSVDLIYASHFIEYFDRDEVEYLLRRWYLALKTDGIVRLAVPDFDAMIDAYTYGYAEVKDLLGPLYGKMLMDGKTIYHKTVYNEEHLSDLLIRMGFKNIRRWDFNNTEHSKFDDCSKAHFPHDPVAIKKGKFDIKKHFLISLNMEATK